MKDFAQIEATISQKIDTKNNLMELLKKRWSPRSFSDEKISHDMIRTIFDAGRQVMSCYNEQPWHVILASKEDPHYEKLFDCLGDFNKQWVKTAPCLGVVLGKKHFTEGNKINKHRFYDSGAFMATSTLRAMSLDLFVHQMAGFSPEKVTERFDVPEEFEPITMFVIGKRAAPDQLPDNLQKKEHKKTDRKEISEFLFGERWGVPY